MSWTGNRFSYSLYFLTGGAGTFSRNDVKDYRAEAYAFTMPSLIAA